MHWGAMIRILCVYRSQSFNSTIFVFDTVIGLHFGSVSEVFNAFSRNGSKIFFWVAVRRTFCFIKKTREACGVRERAVNFYRSFRTVSTRTRPSFKRDQSDWKNECKGTRALRRGNAEDRDRLKKRNSFERQRYVCDDARDRNFV